MRKEKENVGIRETPLFRHDCAHCVFLGSYDGFDIYVCGQSEFGLTVIARFSDEGPEYHSGLWFNRDPMFFESPWVKAARHVIFHNLLGGQNV